MMNVLLIGAPASGKMTIGHELETLTGAKLFHNHDSIDFALRLMGDYSPEMLELNTAITLAVYEAFAKSGRFVIGTVMLDFDNADHVSFLEYVQMLFHQNKQAILFVELETSLEEQLRRNRTEHRLLHKPLKRQVEISEREIRETADTWVFNPETPPDFIDHYFKLDNSNLSAQEAARLIVDRINFIEENKE